MCLLHDLRYLIIEQQTNMAFQILFSYLLLKSTYKYWLETTFVLFLNRKLPNFIHSGCENGFFGPKCLQECPYPSYGKDCQEICSCDNETCNHKHGCLSMYHDNHSQCYLFCVAFNPSHTLNMYNVVIFEYRYTNVRWRQVAFNWLQNINAHYYWHKFAAVIRLPIKKENSLTEIKYRFI